MTDEPVETSESGDLADQDDHALLMAFRTQTKKNHMGSDEFLDLVAQLRERDLLREKEDYQAIIKGLGPRLGRRLWPEAFRTVMEMREKNFALNAKLYKEAVSICGRGKAWEQALALREAMREDQIDPSMQTYIALMGACSVAGEWQRAIGLLAEAQKQAKWWPAVDLYTSAIWACEKSSQWKEALVLLADAIDNELKPNVYTYTAAVTACEKGGYMDLIQDLLFEMWQKEVRPNEVTYESVIRACGKVGMPEKALQLLDSMEDEGIKLSPQTFMEVINVFQSAEGWRTALQQFQRMKDKDISPNVGCYLSMINACDKGKATRWCMDLLREGQQAGLTARTLEGFRDKGVVPPPGAFYAALLAALDRCDVAEACMLAKEMVSLGIKPHKQLANAFIFILERRAVTRGSADSLKEALGMVKAESDE